MQQLQVWMSFSYSNSCIITVTAILQKYGCIAKTAVCLQKTDDSIEICKIFDSGNTLCAMSSHNF